MNAAGKKTADGRKPRILILADMMGSGGMERQILEMMKGLKRNENFSVVLGVFDQGGSREEEAKALADVFLALPRKSRFDVSPAYTLIRRMKTLNICLIHTFGWMSGAAGLAAAKVYGLPVINGGVRGAPPSLCWREKLNRWCALHSNSIVANTRAGLESFHLTRQPHAKVIYNGVDFNRFSDAAPNEHLGKYICMVANFNPNKDHATIVEAFSIVQDRFPGIHLVLVGHDIGTLAAVRELVTRRGLDDCVTFVTDSIHPEPIIARSEIGVLTSQFGEGISNSILEYMFLRKPVVATDCSGNRELLEDGKTGMLVPEKSPIALADAISYLLAHPDLGQKIGAAGHAFVREHFTLDRMVSDYEQLYNHLLSA